MYPHAKDLMIHRLVAIKLISALTLPYLFKLMSSLFPIFILFLCSAFVAPVYIQAFTSETRSKLVARCQGKTVKDFSRAVEEICKAFEELQRKKTGGSGEVSDSTAACCMTSNDDIEDGKHLLHCKGAGLKDELKVPEQRESDDIKGPDDEEYGLEHHSLSPGDAVPKDITDGIARNSSPVLVVKKEIKAFDEGTFSPNNGTISNTKNVSCSSPGKGEICFVTIDGNGESMTPECGKVEAHSNGSDATKRDGLSDGEEDSPVGLVDGNDDGSSPLAVSFQAKSSRGQRAIKKSHGKRKVAPEPRRKTDYAVEVHRKISTDPKSMKTYSSDGHFDRPESSEHIDEVTHKRVQGKITSCSNVRESPPHALKSDADVVEKENTRKKRKSSYESKKRLVRVDSSLGARIHKKTALRNVEKVSDVELLADNCSRKGGRPRNGKRKMAASEDLQPPKRSRRRARGDDTAERSAFVGRKIDSKCSTTVKGKGHELSEAKKSGLHSKAENHVASNAEGDGCGSHLIAGNEAELPIMKRRQVLEAMPDVATKAVGNVVRSGLSKNVKMSSDCDKSPSIQVLSKRRLCRRLDDDEGEVHCKTPVHRGSGSILKTTTSNVSDGIHNTNFHQGNPCHSHSDVKDVIDDGLGAARPDNRTSKDNISPLKMLNEFILSSPRLTEDNRLKNAHVSHVTSITGNRESQIPSSDDKSANDSVKDVPGFVNAPKTVESETLKPQVKPSGTSIVEKMLGGALKGSYLGTDGLNCPNNLVMAQRKTPTSSEKLKITPKTNSHMNTTSENWSYRAGSVEHCSERDILPGEGYGILLLSLLHVIIIYSELLLILYLFSLLLLLLLALLFFLSFAFHCYYYYYYYYFDYGKFYCKRKKKT